MFWLQKVLFYLYIIAIPFVSAFAITDKLTISLIINILMFINNIILFFFMKKQKVFRIPSSILLMCFIIILVTLTTFIFNGIIFNGINDPQVINHFISYITVYFLFFINVLYVMNNYYEYILTDRIFQLLSFTLIIASLFTIVESASVNFFHINLNDYVPRPSVTYYDASIVGETIRSRGFAGESGIHALMIEILSPICIYYYAEIKKNRFYLILYTFIFIMSIIVTYSTASFISIGIVSSLYLIARLKYLLIQFFKIFIKPFRLILISGFIYFLIYLESKASVFFFFYLSIITKIDSSSQRDREHKLNDAYDFFINSDLFHFFIGYGPSGFKNAGLENAIISFYPNLIFETGFFGFLFFLFFIVLIFLFFTKIKSKIKYYIIFGYTVGIIHYFFIGDYWLPWIWFLMAFGIHYFLLERKNIKIENTNIVKQLIKNE